MYMVSVGRIGLFGALAFLSGSVVCGLGDQAVGLAHQTVIALDLLACSVRAISLCLDGLGVVGFSIGDLLSIGVGLGLFGLARFAGSILLSGLGLDVVLKLCAIDVGVLAEAVLHVPTNSC